MSRLAHTTRQVSWSLVSYVVPMISALFFTPLIIEGLGVERYGLLLLTMTTVGFMAMLDLGLGAASIREMSVARAKADLREGRAVFATVALIFLGLAAIGATVLLAIGDWLVADVFTIPAGMEDEALSCVRLAALGLSINLLTPPFSALLASAERFDVRARIAVIATATSTGLVLWRGLAGDLVGAVLGQMSGSALGLLLQIIAARRIDPGRVGPARPDRTVARSLATFSAFQMLSASLAQVTKHLSKLLLAARFGTAEVAWFGTPHGLAARVPALLASAAGVLYPRVATMSAAGDETAVPDTYRVAQKLISTFALAMCLPVSIMAEPLLIAWLGVDFASHAVVPLMVLGLSFAIVSMDIAMVHTMLGLNRPRDVVKTDLPPAVTNVVGTFVLISLLGIAGAALALLLAYLMLGFRLRRIRQLVGPRGTRGILSLVLRVALIALLSGLLLRPAAEAAVGLTVLGPLCAIGVACALTLGAVLARPALFGCDAQLVRDIRGAAWRKLRRRHVRAT